MLKVIFQHVEDVHDFRLPFYESQHDNAECILELGMFVKLI